MAAAIKINGVYLLAGAAIAAALAYVAAKGVKQTGQAVGGALVDMADGVVGGVVTGVGGWVGIPETSLSECEKAKAEGRTWDASFACTAKDFIGYLFE